VPTPDRWHIGPTQDRPGFGWTPLGVTVRDFFSLTGGPSYADLGSARSTCKGRVPPDMLAIGSDDGGNLILLCTEGSASGSIWYWDHDNESPSEEPWRDNLLPLAPSFASFIEGLMTFEEHQDRAEADLRQVIDGGDDTRSEPMAQPPIRR
jgi:hypothetical protein